MLSVSHLKFSYGRRVILQDVSLAARPSEVISLIGPNGSGKSTLLRCMAGLLPSAKGEVLIDGKPVRGYGSREFAEQVAFLPQSQNVVYGFTVYEFVLLGRSPHHRSGWFVNKEDREKTNWAIDYMRLERLKNRQVEKLSGGEWQRARIAMVLAQDTQYILLDEPVTYMDIKYQVDLLKIIRDLRERYEKTVIAVFHDMNHAIEVSDRICLLKDGVILGDGTADSVITERAIQDAYGVCARVCRVPCCRKNVVIPFGVEGSAEAERAIAEN